MISKVSTLTLCLAIALVWGTTASAQTKAYPVTGTYRAQIGNGLPVPIIQPPVAVSGAEVVQPAIGPDPRSMMFAGSEFQRPGQPTFPLGVFDSNDNVFQVKTNLAITFPNGPVTFEASGRTGGPIVSFCAGDTVLPGGNPTCGTPGQGNINGRLRYVKTTNQFGGVAQAKLLGTADVAININGLVNDAGWTANNGCDYMTNAQCQVGMAVATPQATGAIGAAFGFFNSSPGSAPANGLRNAVITQDGVVAAVTATGLGAGVTNAATSFGAPWTTGMLQLQNSTAEPPEAFSLTGSDNRVNGIGSISLVAGSVSFRTQTKGNANRGWLTMTVGSQTPALGTWGMGALAVVLAGVAARRLRKRA